RLARSGGSLVAIGTRRDVGADSRGLEGCDRVLIPDWLDRPAASAAVYSMHIDRLAKRSGAHVLLLPAANRRTTAAPPVAPTVSVVHDLAQLHIPGKYDALRMLYVRHWVIRALRRARVLIAVSRATRDDVLGALGKQAPNVRVVPNGVDYKRFGHAA